MIAVLQQNIKNEFPHFHEHLPHPTRQYAPSSSKKLSRLQSFGQTTLKKDS